MGRDHQEADEETATSERDPFEVDANVVDRSLRAHAAVQSELARHVETLGRASLSPAPSDPEFDVAWALEGHIWVAEVRSLTDRNEEQQLRLGLAQVLRYRNLLVTYFNSVTAVLAVERRPRDSTWGDLCGELGTTTGLAGALRPARRPKPTCGDSS